MAPRRPLLQLVRDNSGAALIEFAMVAPVLVMALMGFFDIGYNIYAASMLEGTIQKAARDSTIQNADISGAYIDGRVSQAVRRVVPSASITFERASYTNFADINRPEDFTDRNNDGVCNVGEPFEDVNGNNTWDSNRGSVGAGGARDAVLYTVNVTYDRKFPLAKMIGLPPTVTTSARTVLRNQPYSMQDQTTTIGNCPA